MAINGLALGTNNISAQLASKLDVAGGKILQIVRATDSTRRQTTSTTFTDVTGMSVTITPSKSTSAVLIESYFYASVPCDSVGMMSVQITDSSNNPISGADNLDIRPGANSGKNMIMPLTVRAYATPATTSAVTYKLRFKSLNAAITVTIDNPSGPGQMYATEVSA